MIIAGDVFLCAVTYADRGVVKQKKELGFQMFLNSKYSISNFNFHTIDHLRSSKAAVEEHSQSISPTLQTLESQVSSFILILFGFCFEILSPLRVVSQRCANMIPRPRIQWERRPFQHCHISPLYPYMHTSELMRPEPSLRHSESTMLLSLESEG